MKGEVGIVESRERITAILYEHARFNFEQMIFRRNPENVDSLRRVMHRDLILSKRFLNDRSLELYAIRRFDEKIFSIVKL